MRSIGLVISGLALAVVLAACGSANAVDPSASAAAADPNAIHVQAKGLEFATKEIDAGAGKAFTIAFDNSGGSAPHNVDILDASGKSVFQGSIIDAGKSASYSVPALVAGTYSFKCDLHPDMKGTVVVK